MSRGRGGRTAACEGSSRCERREVFPHKTIILRHRVAMTQVHIRLRARGAMRPRLHLSSAPWRAWGMPGAHCTRDLVCTLHWVRKHTSNNEYTGNSRHSRTQWF